MNESSSLMREEKNYTYHLYEEMKEVPKNRFSPVSEADIPLEKMSWIGSIVSAVGQLILCPCVVPFGFITVEPQEELIVSYWGKPIEVVNKPGTYYYNTIGRGDKKVSTKIMDLTIQGKKVNDFNASPIVVTGLVNYRINHVLNASYKLENLQKYLFDQVGASMRDIAAKYPYDSSERDVPCLRRPTEELKIEMKEDLQDRVSHLGIEILNFQYTDIGYDENMAATLLAKQKAQATLDSRKILTDGIALIAVDTVDKLKEKGIELSEEAKSEAAVNLLYLLSNNTNGNVNLFLGKGINGAAASS